MTSRRAWAGPVGLLLGILCGCGGRPASLVGPTGVTAAPVLAGGLRFAVFGDARPPKKDRTEGYPSAIVRGIFSAAESHGVRFVVGTGDYSYASDPTQIDAQVQRLLDAESLFSGRVYHALGNHECDGWTASNCPTGSETANVRAFMARLAPPGAATPYYRVDLPTPLGMAKLLVLAANAWSDAQARWLKQQLGETTRYTIVVRHEPGYDTEAPGVRPSEALLAKAPVTLALFGHAHEYRRLGAHRVLCGNGGAPLAARAAGFGWLLVEQLENGNLSVTEFDEATGEPTDSFRVTPQGASADSG